MRRRRVAMVLNAAALGGVTEVVYQLVARLSAGGVYQPSVFFLKPPHGEDLSRGAQCERFARLGIELRYASGEGGKVGAIAELTRYIADAGIEILHTHSYRPNVYGRMAGAVMRPGGLAIVAHYHNHYDDKWSCDPAALILERALASTTDAMIAVSAEVRQHIASTLAISSTDIDVIDNGVDGDRFKPADRQIARERLGLDPLAFVIGVVGRICEQKGQEDLVEAVLASAGLEAAQIVFFGDIEDRALHGRLKERIAEAGRVTSFRFFGHVGDVPLAYAASDIVAVPSRWEGCPLVIAEAMSCGRPIIATSVSAIPTMVAHGRAAVLVPPQDFAALASALSDLVHDAGRREQLAQEGLAHSSRYSWDTAVGQLTRVYDRVVAGDRVARRCA